MGGGGDTLLRKGSIPRNQGVQTYFHVLVAPLFPLTHPGALAATDARLPLRPPSCHLA